MYKLIFFLFFVVTLKAQELKPFQLYRSDGKKVKYKKMVHSLKSEDVVLFGEYHNNTFIHWVQLQLFKDLSRLKNTDLALEMFERDQQSVINEYINETITEKQFDSLTRFWSNYKTDYHQLVDYAKSIDAKVIASNIPRKYANMVFKKGIESLSELSLDEKQWIVSIPFPFDIELKSYQEMLKASTHMQYKENFPKAQAIKDATMAESIVKYFEKGKLIYHINGSFHSNFYEGIVWYLNQYAPYMKVKTITMFEVDDIEKFSPEHKNSADFIFYIPVDMTKSY